MSGLRFQQFSHLAEHMLERFHRNLALMTVEYFHEARHVRAFEIVRQVHVHVEIGDGVLLAAGTVADADRVTDILDPDLVDRNTARIGAALHVLDGFDSGLAHEGWSSVYRTQARSVSQSVTAFTCTRPSLRASDRPR